MKRQLADDRADHAAAILDDRADLRVVEEDVDDEQRQREDGVETEPDEERRALDGDVRGQRRIELVEQPLVVRNEQRPVDRPTRSRRGG